MLSRASVMILGVVLSVACRGGSDPVADAVPPTGAAPLQPALATERVANDPDDPAIWIHPSDSARSLIVATDKFEATGGLYVFGLDGRIRQTIAPLDRPNNVDIEYAVQLHGRTQDIAVVTERKQHRLRVYAIDPAHGELRDLAPAGLPVLQDAAGAASEPMGLAIYKRPADGAAFVIVAPKTGGQTDYLAQYRLEGRGGGLAAVLVRRFGRFSRGAGPDDIGEIEAVTVDDERGFVYYSDERFGIRKYHADPDHPDAARELLVFGTGGYAGDREGLSVYAPSGAPGFIVSSDQVPEATRLQLFSRDGNHDRLATLVTTADSTDGLDVTARRLPGFPDGLLVMMNSRAKNFLLYRWTDVAQLAGQPTARHSLIHRP